MTESAPTEAGATAFDINAYLLAPRIVLGAIAATPIFMVAVCGVMVAEQEIQPVDEAHLMALGIVSLSLLFAWIISWLPSDTFTSGETRAALHAAVPGSSVSVDVYPFVADADPGYGDSD